jgi:hypothetical protein
MLGADGGEAARRLGSHGYEVTNYDAEAFEDE